MIQTEFLTLKSITPNRFLADIDRSKLSSENINVSLSLHGSLSDITENTNGDKTTTLALTAMIDSNKSNQEPKFSNPEDNITLGYSINYDFVVRDIDGYTKLSEENKSKLCSAMVYLDFRSKLLQSLASIGMGNLKIPLNIHEL